MKIDLPFDCGTFSFTIPDANIGDLVRGNPVTPPADPFAEIRRALAAPIGSPKLRDLVKPGQRACVICEDITRITDTRAMMKAVMDELHAAGLKEKDILVLMALGTHRDMTPGEIEKKVGADIASRYRVFNSEFRDKSRLRKVGEMPGGVPLWVDARLFDTDIRIGVGSIFPHPAAGFGGGAKIIIPGVTGEDTVAAFHHAYGEHTGFMFGDENSPIRAQMESWVAKIGLHFIVNAITTTDHKIYRIVAGDFVKAHREGVKAVKKVYGVKAGKPADLVIVNSYPAESDFWQATKAFGSAYHLVKEGGTILMLTPCPEGLGPHSRYAEYIGLGDDPEWLAKNLPSLHAEERIPLSGGRTMMRWRGRFTLAVHSPGLKKSDMETAKIVWVDHVDRFIEDTIRTAGPAARVSVVYYGSEIFAYKG